SRRSSWRTSSRWQRRILRPDEPQATILTHPSRFAARSVAESPEKIRAHGTADRTAGILRNYQALERPRGQRVRCRKEERSAQRNEARIDCHGPLCEERYAERSNRSVDRRIERARRGRRDLAKKTEAGFPAGQSGRRVGWGG